MINITINNESVSVSDGITILEAAKQHNIDIPNLCYLEGVHKFGGCRLCVVEVEGEKNLQASCMVQVKEGMVIHTNTDNVRKVRKNLFELLLSNHPQDCLQCERSLSCELQEMGKRLGVTHARFTGKIFDQKIDVSPAIVRDKTKCIQCRRCVTVCNEIQNVGILNAQNRGMKTFIGTAMDLPIDTVDCTTCGQCTVVCPVGALQETDAIQNVWSALGDTSKHTIVQFDSAVSAAIDEELDAEFDPQVTAELVACLRRIGFDDVFDTNFANDLSVRETSSEFLSRLKDAFGNDGTQSRLPMLTSCSPAWVKYVEHTFPEQLNYLSTAKSPHVMLGALAKSYYAEKIEQDPKDMFVVSIMPCTAKKFEITRPELRNSDRSNVDAVLTTRELAEMIKQAGIDLHHVGKSQYDAPFALSSGAAESFSVAGGVMEANLSTIYKMATNRELPVEKIHFTSVKELNHVVEAEIIIENPVAEYQVLDGFTLKAAVVSGLQEASSVMNQLAERKSPYHLVEVMGCPGGCINGGGQPRPTTTEISEKRLQSVEKLRKNKTWINSHENIHVDNLYNDYLKQENGTLSQELLHTHYIQRGR